MSPQPLIPPPKPRQDYRPAPPSAYQPGSQPSRGPPVVRIKPKSGVKPDLTKSLGEKGIIGNFVVSDGYLTKTAEAIANQEYLIDDTPDLRQFLEKGNKGFLGIKKTYSFELYRPSTDPKKPAVVVASLVVEKDGRKRLRPEVK